MKFFRTKVSVWLVFVSLLLSGCYQVKVDARVENDNSGTVAYVIAVDADQLTSMSSGVSDNGDGSTSREQVCDDFAEGENGEIPSEATVEPYEEGDYCGVRVTIDVPGSDDFSAEFQRIISSTADESSNQTEQDIFYNLDFNKEANDTWNFTLDFQGESLADILGMGDSGEEVPASVMNSFDFSYVISMPGRPGAHNADKATESDGFTTFEWQLATDEGIESLQASTSPEGENGESAGSSIVKLLIALAVVAGVFVIIGGIYYFVKGRNSDSGSSEEEVLRPEEIK